MSGLDERAPLREALHALSRVEAFAEEHAGSSPTVAWCAWQSVWNGTPYPPGRNDLPACLYDLWIAADGQFGSDFFAHAVPDAWTSAEIPGHALDREDWLWLWADAGYSYDGVDAPRRRRIRPVRLYRVALLSETEGDDMGLSWTPSIQFARQFRTLRDSRFGKEHHIVSALVAPQQIVAEITRAWDGGRSEPEVIADVPTRAVERHPQPR